MLKQKKKQTIIIIDGHDMSGKTTIIKELSTQTKIPVFKLNKNLKQFDHLVDLLYGVESTVQQIEQTECSIILDRFYPSEYAYAKITERYTLHDKIFNLDKRMSKMNTYIIICYKTKKKYQEDDKNYIGIEKYTTLIKEFRNFAKQSHCKIAFLDTSDEDLNNQIKKILKFIRL